MGNLNKTKERVTKDGIITSIEVYDLNKGLMTFKVYIPVKEGEFFNTLPDWLEV